MKKLVLILIVLACVAIPIKKIAAQSQSTVTGCPYGDAIPVDSPKCSPTASQSTVSEQQVAPAPVISVTVPESFSGK